MPAASAAAWRGRRGLRRRAVKVNRRKTSRTTHGQVAGAWGPTAAGIRGAVAATSPAALPALAVPACEAVALAAAASAIAAAAAIAVAVAVADRFRSRTVRRSTL